MGKAFVQIKMSLTSNWRGRKESRDEYHYRFHEIAAQRIVRCDVAVIIILLIQFWLNERASLAAARYSGVQRNMR